ncbi:MAG: hypothetical protein GY851_07285 [bacterium]|nr:hypothetical protein [bacterium]
MQDENRRWTDAETGVLLRAIEHAAGGDIPPAIALEALAGVSSVERTRHQVSNKVYELRRRIEREEAFAVAMGQDTIAQHDALPPVVNAVGVPSRLPVYSETGQMGHAAKYQLLTHLAEEAMEMDPVETTPGKGLCISDTHGHLMRPDVVRAAVLSNLDAEWVAVVGDVFDFHDTSFFSNPSSTPLIAEWDLCGALLEALSDIYERVIIVRGNHDARPGKLVSRILDNPDLLPLMRGAMDPLSLLCQGYGYSPEGEMVERYHWTGSVEYDREGIANSDGAVTRVGETLLSHTDLYYGAGQIPTPGVTCCKISNMYLTKRGEMHDCLVQAHTHGLTWAAVPSGGIALECGCCSDEPEYTTNQKLRYAKQIPGWALVYQHPDGTCDMERTRVQYYGGGR